MESLKASGQLPKQAIEEFGRWIEKVSGTRKPVFVGFNATFDWAFVNWYFHSFFGKNPFGIGGIDIKAFYMGYAGTTWNQTRSSQMPAEFRPASKDAHNALEDARSQARCFESLLAATRRQERKRS
jgi:hypothetical protein